MKNPQISIIIPVFNAEECLSRCIESILNQTFKEWELILVDDGSTDGSADLCTEYSQKDDRIVSISQKNAGPSAARNRGISLAQGDYIAFIDADDWIEEDMLFDYVQSTYLQPFDIVFQGFTREFDSGRIEKSFASDNDSNHTDKFEIICKLYKENVFGWAWCKIFKRCIIEENNLRFNEGLNLWEDELFTIEFLKYANSIKTQNLHHYHYIYYASSLMNKRNTPLKRLMLSEIMNENLKIIANEELMNHINSTYNYNLKFSLLMALMGKEDYQCDNDTKKRLLSKYYQRCQEFPSLSSLNVLRSKISYYIAETILSIHHPELITYLFSKI